MLATANLWLPTVVITLVFGGLVPGLVRAQNADWMYELIYHGTYLSDLTIPGTHDSGARYDPRGRLLAGTAKAQNLTIPQQLEAGVRFFDIRLNFAPPVEPFRPFQDLYVFHGPVPQWISAITVFDWFVSFLNDHPGEMIFLSIKNEAVVDHSKYNATKFQAAVEKLLVAYSDRILSTTEVPRYSSDLADKQRIIIVRRYPLIYKSDSLVPVSIDATDGWPLGDENGADGEIVSARMKVQDRFNFACSGWYFCNLGNSEERTKQDEKLRVVEDFFQTAKNTEGDFDGVHWLYLSFASATMHPQRHTIPTTNVIPWFAEYVNNGISSDITTYRARAGAILLDRASEDLVAKLITMNRLRPFETGAASTSAGTAMINPMADMYCNGAARSVCFELADGTVVSLGGIAVGRPAVALGNKDETSVFVVGEDHALYTRWQTAPNTDPSAFNPSSWTYLGGDLTSDPEAIRNCNRVMEVFARGQNEEILTTQQAEPGGTWLEWSSLGGKAHSRPIVSVDGCNVTVTVIGADGYSRTKTRTNLGWGDWTSQ